jgi:hypothetical protein
VIPFGGAIELSLEMNCCTGIGISDEYILEYTLKHFCRKEMQFYQTRGILPTIII